MKQLFSFSSGISAFFDGKPTGNNKLAFSFLGLPNNFSKKPIGEGVCGSVTSPEQ